MAMDMPVDVDMDMSNVDMSNMDMSIAMCMSCGGEGGSEGGSEDRKDEVARAACIARPGECVMRPQETGGTGCWHAGEDGCSQAQGC